MMNAGDLIKELSLTPHPEGGWYAETHRDSPPDGRRGSLTQIYYLLEAGQSSAWHRVNDATEIWHHYAGGPLILRLSMDGRSLEEQILGPDIAAGQVPQIVVPPGCWQAALPLAGWSLSGCTVAPAFEFAAFEMAPEGWEPGAD
jgi:predicted cupin superfamily sugar epimerase